MFLGAAWWPWLCYLLTETAREVTFPFQPKMASQDLPLPDSKIHSYTTTSSVVCVCPPLAHHCNSEHVLAPKFSPNSNSKV